MMSYLWILLLGSLLATSAKAQDDEAPTEEKAAPETPALEADTATEVDEESATGKETEHTAEEISPTTGEPELEAAADEAGTPAVEEAEPVATPAADVEADAEAEATPAAEQAEAGAEAEAEAEATTTKQADLEVVDPKAEEPTVLGEEEATSITGETPAQEESGSEATPAVDPAVADIGDKSTVPAAADAEPTQPAVDEKVEPEVEVPVTTINKVEIGPEVNADVEFSLGDALPEENAVDSPGQRRSSESGPHVAGASGEADKPEAQEASSGSMAAILSAIGVSIVGAIVGFFTYQKKKLCFKNRQEADPEAARKADATEAQSDPQVLSNLLKSS